MREKRSELLNENMLIDWLRLARTPRIGPVTFFQLIEKFGDASTALAELPALTRNTGASRDFAIPSASRAMDEVAAHRKIGADLVPLSDPRYPNCLRHIADPPPVISVRGRLELLERTTIAVVGARNASGNGRRLAGQLARDLGTGGLVVSSGMARGIDAAAHFGALATGTVGVLAGGIDVIYPRENTELYEHLLERGLVISEAALGTQPRARHFPRRNRIISGLSRGVVVVEATLRSGSLITARVALDQGRDVFAVPGSVFDARAQGTNRLIRDGAYLTESADDVFDAMDWIPQSPPAVGESNEDTTGRSNPSKRPDSGTAGDDNYIRAGNGGAMLDALEKWIGPTPTPLDDILREHDISPPALSNALLELELAGRLNRHPGNMVSIEPA